MTVVVPVNPERRRGRPSGASGNGKTIREMEERVKKIDAQVAIKHRLAQANLEIKAAESRAEMAIAIADRRKAQADRVIETYEAQEVVRAPQLQIDQKPIFWILIVIAGAVFLSTALLTADGTIGAAESARFGIDWFSYILFFVFEASTLGFMLMYYIRGSRIDIITGQRVKASQWFVAMLISAILTVVLSTYHVLDLYGYAWGSIDMWFGIGIRITAATFFVIISKGIAGVIFAKALDLNEIAKIGTGGTEETS